jgi:quinol monooxygenase YgiN
MVTLDPQSGDLVLINTFTVDPDKADALLSALSKTTENGMKQRARFISASLHVSRDRTHVANYAQWRSQDDLGAMMNDPDAQAHMREAGGIATSFETIYYDLRETHAAEDGA